VHNLGVSYQLSAADRPLILLERIKRTLSAESAAAINKLTADS
jgi:hypothetical protein